MRVMIVERNPVLGRLLKDRVTAHGYRVSLAGDGPTARTMVRASPYDVLVLDASLDAWDNRNLLESWRTWGEHRPVLVLDESKDVEDLVARIGASLRDCLAARSFPTKY